jgi:hypothetical protein
VHIRHFVHVMKQSIVEEFPPKSRPFKTCWRMQCGLKKRWLQVRSDTFLVFLLNSNSETHTAKNGFSFNEFSNILLNMVKIYVFITFIFYHRSVLKQDHKMTHLLSFVNTVLWCSSCKFHRYVAVLPYM